jgi:hypothetical protein
MPTISMLTRKRAADDLLHTSGIAAQKERKHGKREVN